MEYKVLTLPLPADVHGAVKQLRDDRYLIAVNETLTKAEMDATVGHELYHITHRHFDDPRPIQEIEAETELAARPATNYRIGEWICITDITE